MRQRRHSLECYNNIFPNWGKISAVLMNTSGCFYWLHGYWLLFIPISSISISYMKGHRFFFIAKNSYFSCDMKGLAATGLTETFWIQVMYTLLGDWRGSAWLQPAFLLLSNLFMGFHEIVLTTCCGTKCDQRFLRVRSPDSCSLLLPLLSGTCRVWRLRADTELAKPSGRNRSGSLPLFF